MDTNINQEEILTDNKYDGLVSVIMPVHNGQDYLRQTLDCVISQTYQNLEIILVDDGSTDDTGRIVNEYMTKDARIAYYPREKSNAGVCRNYGYGMSNGEYVIFLDSDDLFEHDMIEIMVQKTVSDRADICVCNADQYDTEKDEYISKPQYLRMKDIPEARPFSRKEIGNRILYFTTSVPWNKLLRRGFIEDKKLHFQDIERANDQFFAVTALLSAEAITIVEGVLVHYRVKQKGNLTTEFSDTPLCAYQAMAEIDNYLSQSGLLGEPDVRCAFDNKIINLMIYSLNIQRDVEGYKKLYNLLHDGGFERLGLVVQDEDYYFNPLEYENLKNIIKLSYDEFLLMKNREYRDVIAGKNVAYKKMVKEKNEQIKELKIKEKELNTILRKKWYQKMVKLIDIYHKIIGRK